jgi:hypothetical protein
VLERFKQSLEIRQRIRNALRNDDDTQKYHEWVVTVRSKLEQEYFSVVFYRRQDVREFKRAIRLSKGDYSITEKKVEYDRGYIV